MALYKYHHHHLFENTGGHNSLLLSIPAVTTVNTAVSNVEAIRGRCGSVSRQWRHIGFHRAVFLGATPTTMARHEMF